MIICDWLEWSFFKTSSCWSLGLDYYTHTFNKNKILFPFVDLLVAGNLIQSLHRNDLMMALYCTLSSKRTEMK